MPRTDPAHPGPPGLLGASGSSGLRRPRWRRRAVAATVAVIAAASVVAGVLTGRQQADTSTGIAAPWEFAADGWTRTLGGDEPMTAQRLQQVAQWADPALPAADREALVRLAGKTAQADLDGRGRTADEDYWPPKSSSTSSPAVPPCRDVTVLAASPAALPVVEDDDATYAKVLVAYVGQCEDATGSSVSYTAASPGVTYVYARKDVPAAGAPTGTWTPLRSWRVPTRPEVVTAQSAAEPAEWELKTFSTCGAPETVRRARIMVVDAFTTMCLDARKAGVDLQVVSAFRTRAEQAAVFAQAVRDYGSEQEARRWVAYADEDVCTSRHCSGVALNVRPTSSAMRWLTAVAGCRVAANGPSPSRIEAASTCPPGAATVPRMARYGFAEPIQSSPGYLEFTLPVGAGAPDSTAAALSAADCAPAGVPIPNMVAAIFRCRLAREMVTGPEQDRVVAEALVVSRCESGWNASARAFAGRFAEAANPADGRRYTQAGVFMIGRDLADGGWLTGGYRAVADPVANINAAASLWLSTRGWEQFGCAVGVTGGFEAGPVLPQHGGPELPSWAAAY